MCIHHMILGSFWKDSLQNHEPEGFEGTPNVDVTFATANPAM